jgi:hypothetical protein
MSIKITTNVLGLGAVAGFGAQSFIYLYSSFEAQVHLKHKAPSLHITPPNAIPFIEKIYSLRGLEALQNL